AQNPLPPSTAFPLESRIDHAPGRSWCLLSCFKFAADPPLIFDGRNDIGKRHHRDHAAATAGSPIPGSALQPPNAEGEEGFGAPQIKAAQAGFIPALVAPGVDLPFRPGDTRECQAAAGTAGFLSLMA